MKCKKLISLLIVSILLISPFNMVVLPHSALATEVNSNPQLQIQVTRLGGLDRYATAAEITKYGWQKTSDYAVIAYGQDFPDALTATPLAKKYNAPILLTDKGSLSDNTKQELIRLKVKYVFIVGGTGVVSQNVESQINTLGISTTRLWGMNRYETSLKVAEQIGTGNGIVIATGDNFPDALSIAPIAALKGMPILLTELNSLPNCTRDYLNGKQIPQSYVVGGNGVVSDSVLGQVVNAKRLGGINRYETNVKVFNEFEKSLEVNSLFIATGENFPDALAGSALAPVFSSPILLVSSPLEDYTKNLISSQYSFIRQLIVLGGPGAVRDSTVQSILHDFQNIGSASIAENVKIIDANSIPQVQQEIDTVDETSQADTLITLSTPDGTLGNLKTGDIFYMEPTPNNPTGYSGKVVSVSQTTNGQKVLDITQPKINEVFSELKFSIDKPLSSNDIIETKVPNGATLTVGGKTLTAQDLSANFYRTKNNTFKTQELGSDLSFEYSIPLPVGKDLSYKSKVTLKQPRIIQDIDYDSYFGINVPNLKKFNIGFDTTEEDDNSLSGSLSGSIGAKQLRELLGQSNENKTLHIKGIEMDDQVVLFSATCGLGAVPTQFKPGEPAKNVVMGLTMFATLTLEGKPEVTLSLKSSSITQYNVGLKVHDYEPTLYNVKTIIQPETTTLDLTGKFEANFGGGLALGVIAAGVVVGDASINLLMNYNVETQGISITLSDKPPQGTEPVKGSYGLNLNFKGAAGFELYDHGGDFTRTATVSLFGPFEFGSSPEPFNKKDYYSAGIQLGMDENSVKQILGNPISETEKYEDFYQENIITLIYPWGEVDLEHPQDQQTYVFEIEVHTSGIIGPRGTQVGDAVQSIISKFRNDNFPEEYISNYVTYRALYGKDYNYIDGHYWGCVYGDQYGNESDVFYGVDGPGAGGYGLHYVIDNGKVMSYGIGLTLM